MSDFFYTQATTKQAVTFYKRLARAERKAQRNLGKGVPREEAIAQLRAEVGCIIDEMITKVFVEPLIQRAFQEILKNLPNP